MAAVGTALAGTLDLQEVYDLILAQAVRLLPATSPVSSATRVTW